ncbi:MAG: hypothetical protein IPO54_09000 [Micavibrio sp.]|nr:hypothetical protein [Micavibrio sp.]
MNIEKIDQKSLLACGLPQGIGRRNRVRKIAVVFYRNNGPAKTALSGISMTNSNKRRIILKFPKARSMRCLTHPQLFYQSLESIKFNVEGAAELLDIPAHRYIEAAPNGLRCYLYHHK